MTTLVITRAKVPMEQLQEMARQEPNPFAAIRDRAESVGGVLRHRVFHANGEIIVIDEWESADHYRRFSESPELQEAFRNVAGGRPDILFAEEIDLGDKIG